MKSIILINCYFGEFPNYFNLFLDSCLKNSTVDFLIYTNNTSYESFQNIKFIHTSFEELRDKIQSKFDFKICLEAPYKLCDYKPAYGYIFEESIKGYDYWGYCDIDMIFGNIRHFLTDEILDDYDKFYKLGHLTLFRNTTFINRCFMNSETVSYKKAFSTKTITVFDEADGIQRIFDQEGIKTYFARDYADIAPFRNRFTLSGLLVENLTNNNYEKQLFAYRNGQILRYYDRNGVIKSEEFEYIHLQKRKFKDSIYNEDNFFITYNGFFPIRDERIDGSCFHRFNRNIFLKELFMKFKGLDYKVKRKINKTRVLIYEYFTSTVNR